MTQIHRTSLHPVCCHRNLILHPPPHEGVAHFLPVQYEVCSHCKCIYLVLFLNCYLDLDLTQLPDVQARKYPAPPTGHDLMAMFPPAPPRVLPTRTEPTSGYFQRQERAFFAQAGKEILRVRVEVDMPLNGEPLSEAAMNGLGKARGLRDPGSGRSWPLGAGHSPSPTVIALANPQSAGHSPPLHVSSTPASVHSQPSTYPQSTSSAATSRQPQRSGPVSMSSTPHFPHLPPHPGPTPSQGPSNLHPIAMYNHGMGSRTPGQEAAHSGAPNPGKSEFPSEEGRDEDDSWRTPMPYAERRRAGKHTRRVIKV